jgi:hypothetical protein
MARGVPRIAACVAALCATLSHAQESEAPQFTLSGYGTVGLMRSDNDRADYLVDAFRPNGPGYTRRTSADADSRLGLQLSTQLTPRLSAVVQVLSQQRYDNSYRPSVEWANVKYAVTPDLSVRAGRVVLPAFMVTDTRLVGYSNPWIRPPVEMYGMVPVTHNDGFDASYRFTTGRATHTFQLTLGRSDSRFPDASGFDAGTAEVRDLVAGNHTIESGPASLRLSAGQAKLTIAAFRPLFDAYRQFGASGAAIAERYSVDDRRVTFLGLGASYDTGRWFAMAEWARFDTHSVLGAKNAWYASGGYRFAKVTPYATYARIKADSHTSDPGVPLAGLPPEAAATATYLNAILNARLGVLPLQNTLSVGARWDLARNAALKLQYDRVRLRGGARGTFGNVQPDFPPGGRVGLLSAALDFVF